jgi:hypothetical protein
LPAASAVRFYPDEEEYYYQREARPTQEAEMPDCDLDDFYNSSDVEDGDGLSSTVADS